MISQYFGSGGGNQNNFEVDHMPEFQPMSLKSKPLATRSPPTVLLFIVYVVIVNTFLLQKIINKIAACLEIRTKDLQVYVIFFIYVVYFKYVFNIL